MTTLAYPHHNKQMYLDRVRNHREADQLIRGTGWEKGRGCAVGCTLETYDHSLYPSLLGVPVELAMLEDWLFENLPTGHLEWPERFLSAIQPGADLSGVFDMFVCRMLRRCVGYCGTGDEPWRVACIDSVNGMIGAIGSKGDRAAEAAEAAEASGAAWAAEAAEASGAAWAAWAAGAAGAAWAAWAAGAAWVAEASGAAEAAEAAWAAWAAEASGAAEITRQADDLIELLEAAPVPV